MFLLKCLCLWSCVFGLQFTKSEKDIMEHPNWELLPKENCGTSNADRIIGGKSVSLGAYPWIAQVGYISGLSKTPTFRCGGSLINELYVVTAAHCVTKLPSRFKVEVIRLGEHNTVTDPDCVKDYCALPVQDIKPKEIIVHKGYDRVPFENDIALIRLKKPAIFNENVKPICLIRNELLTKNFIGTIAEVAGWGVFDINYPTASTILEAIKLPIVKLEKCRKAFESTTNVGRGQMCVGGKIGYDSCTGDSGGPLMKVEAVDGPPKYYLIGIVSFGSKQCGKFAIPAVYTQVSQYLTWILNHLKP